MNDRSRSVMGAERWFAVAEEQQRLLAERLKGAGGGGTSDGVTDDWKDSVDRQLEQLHGDVRALLYGLVGGFLFLIAAGAAAYVGMSGQVGENRKDLSAQLADTRKDISAMQVEQAKASAKLDALLERTAPSPKR